MAVAADPIFAAIEAHRTACIYHTQRVAAEDVLDYDDPARRRASARTGKSCKKMFSLAYKLLEIKPSTRAGAFALLDYASRAEEPNTGEDWRFPDADGNGKAFHLAMMKHVADALGSIGVA